MEYCVADGASAWLSGYAVGAGADCLAAMRVTAIAGVVLAVAFGLAAAAHAYAAYQHASTTAALLAATAAWAVVGYAFQAAATWSPMSRVLVPGALESDASRRLAAALFLLQTAPALVGVCIYAGLYRFPAASKSSATSVVLRWPAGLLLAFGYFFQTVALGMVVARSGTARDDSLALDDDSLSVAGERIWTASLAAQALGLALLLAATARHYARAGAPSPQPTQSTQSIYITRVFLAGTGTSLLLLLLRTVFRMATTVLAANHAHDAQLPSYRGAATQPPGEGATYARLAWLSVGLDGIPVLLALAALAPVPAARVVPRTELRRLRQQRAAAIRYQQWRPSRPDRRVGPAFDAAAPRARRNVPAAVVRRPEPDVERGADGGDELPVYEAAAPAYEEPRAGGS